MLSLHVVSIIYTQTPLEFLLLVTTLLTLILKVFSLQGKDASKPAGNWFQLLMVLFTKEYLPTSYARDITIQLMSSINVFAN
jgi:hypothetical protein